jgi:hypothetical protein
VSSTRQAARYPTPEFRRLALAPSIIATIVLLATVALIDTDAFLAVQFGVSILALVVAVFVWQSRAWWWLILLVPIAVIWNPVVPLVLPHDVWLAGHYVAAAAFLLVGIMVKVRNVDDKNPQKTR